MAIVISNFKPVEFRPCEVIRAVNYRGSGETPMFYVVRSTSKTAWIQRFITQDPSEKIYSRRIYPDGSIFTEGLRLRKLSEGRK